MNARNLSGPGKRVFLALSFVIVVAAFVQAMFIFIADRYAGIAERVLDDPGTEEKDILDMAEQNIPAFNRALRALEQASALAPMNSDYPRSLSGLYVRLAVWQEAMQAMGAPVPDSLGPVDRLRDAALHSAKQASALDPSNADHLLALGQMYAAAGDREAALVQLTRAAGSYPVNGSIRYAAAMQMLLLGLDRQALEQARLLARYDDSYRLDDDDPVSVQIRERRPPGYEESLAKSYLYKAMEISWRASAKDPKTVNDIVPDNADAREAARLFFEQKGADGEAHGQKAEEGIRK
jgi:tetratricopeptide (TPR) repeat protein